MDTIRAWSQTAFDRIPSPALAVLALVIGMSTVVWLGCLAKDETYDAESMSRNERLVQDWANRASNLDIDRATVSEVAEALAYLQAAEMLGKSVEYIQKAADINVSLLRQRLIQRAAYLNGE